MIAVRFALAGAVAMLAGCQSAGLDLSALMASQQFGFRTDHAPLSSTGAALPAQSDMMAAPQVPPSPALLPDSPLPPQAQSSEVGAAPPGKDYLAVDATLGLSPEQVKKMVSTRSADGRVMLPRLPKTQIVDLSDVRAAMAASSFSNDMPLISPEAPGTPRQPSDPR